MSPEMIQVLSSGGAGVAVIVVTVIFLKYLKGEREQLMADRREERREFLTKLSHVASSVEQLSRALSRRPCLFLEEHANDDDVGPEDKKPRSETHEPTASG